MVMLKPRQFTMVRAVPVASLGAFWATSVENWGESATTTIPHSSRKPRNSGNKAKLYGTGRMSQGCKWQPQLSLQAGHHSIARKPQRCSRHLRNNDDGKDVGWSLGVGGDQMLEVFMRGYADTVLFMNGSVFSPSSPAVSVQLFSRTAGR